MLQEFQKFRGFRKYRDFRKFRDFQKFRKLWKIRKVHKFRYIVRSHTKTTKYISLRSTHNTKLATLTKMTYIINISGGIRSMFKPHSDRLDISSLQRLLNRSSLLQSHSFYIFTFGCDGRFIPNLLRRVSSHFVPSKTSPDKTCTKR